MSKSDRQTRAQTLREFLLSQALTNHLDDVVLQQALAIIKLPSEQLNITQTSLDQLLDEWQQGRVDKEQFLLAWAQITQDQAHLFNLTHYDLKTTPIRYWIPYIVVLAIVLSVMFGWQAYQFWMLEQEEKIASIPNNTTSPAVSLTEKLLNQVTNPCPNCPAPLPTSPAENNHTDSAIENYVTEGLLLAAMAKTAVAEYYVSMGVYPNSNSQIGLAEPENIRGDAVSSVAVGNGGVITITYNKFVGQGQTIIIIPTSTGGGPIVWDCKKGTVPAEYRPPHCQ
jgi:hypothetical protein